MDPAQVLLTATGPRRRLWERQADRFRHAADADRAVRRAGHDPAGHGQGGQAARGADRVLRARFDAAHHDGRTRPGRAGRRVSGRWPAAGAQAAVLHSPRDLSIVVPAADPAAGPHWNWVRWLPHCAPRGSEDCMALVGTDLESASKRVTELVAEVTARLAKAPADAAGGGFGGAAAEPVADSDLGPKILVVLDGARQLRRIPACRNFSPPRRGPASTPSASTSQRACCPKSAPWCCPGTSPGRETATTMACGSGRLVGGVTRRRAVGGPAVPDPGARRRVRAGRPGDARRSGLGGLGRPGWPARSRRSATSAGTTPRP